MKIKKGDKFLCIKDVVMEDEDIDYDKGETYTSEQDGCITNKHGYVEHEWCRVPYFDNYFVNVNEGNVK